MESHRPRKCPWAGSRRRKKRKSTDSKSMSEETRTGLAASDKGSYCQEWPSDSSDEEDNVDNAGASRQKITRKDKRGSLEVWSNLDKSSDSESPDDFDDGDEESSSETLKLVDGQLLQDALRESAICRDCKTSELQLLEERDTRSGQGQVWVLQCKRVDCKSHKHPTRFHTSPKNSRFYDVNRAIVLAFRSIGRGYSAAQKFCSIVNLPNPVNKRPWSQHTKAILKVMETMLEQELCDAAFAVKKILRDVGDIEDCSDEELREKIINAGASLDGSWSSRDWTARDGMVAAISVESGKVVDVVYLSSSCNQCTKMEEKRNRGQISRCEYMEW